MKEKRPLGPVQSSERAELSANPGDKQQQQQQQHLFPNKREIAFNLFDLEKQVPFEE